MALQGILRRFSRKTRPAGSPRVRPARLVVGLGNPGSEYRRTRHNAGFLVVDELARRWNLRFGSPKKQARLALGEVAGVPVALLEPLTYMNVSGEAVARAQRELHLTAADVIVAYDDVDLPLGRIRLRPQGSAAGHKGILSIMGSLGTQEFARLRIGIGRPNGGDVRDYVLSPFTEDEEAVLADVLDRATAAIETFLTAGVDVAMNEHNK